MLSPVGMVMGDSCLQQPSHFCVLVWIAPSASTLSLLRLAHNGTPLISMIAPFKHALEWRVSVKQQCTPRGRSLRTMQSKGYCLLLSQMPLTHSTGKSHYVTSSTYVCPVHKNVLTNCYKFICLYQVMEWSNPVKEQSKGTPGNGNVCSCL